MLVQPPANEEGPGPSTKKTPLVPSGPHQRPVDADGGDVGDGDESSGEDTVGYDVGGGSGGNDDDGPSYVPKGRDFYTSTTFDSKRHQWLCGFFKYLGTPDAGFKNVKTREQHVSQVRHILEAVQPKGDDLRVLGEEDGDSVWTRWVQKHLQAKNKAPGTLISYLTSYEKFLVFLTAKKYKKNTPSLGPELRETLKDVIPSLNGWRTVVSSCTQPQQNELNKSEKIARKLIWKL